MNKVKKEFIILGVIVVLLSLYLVFHSTGKLNYTIPELKKVDDNVITKISITVDGKKASVVTNGTEWRTGKNNYRADMDIVGEILTKLKKLTLVDMVSESKNYKIYGLDNKKAILVQAKDKEGNTIRDIKIGNPSTGGSFTYVMINNDSKVYTAKGRLRSTFDINSEKLMDKKILSYVPDDIIKIDIKNGSSSLVLVKEKKDGKTTWKTEDGKMSIPEDKISTYLSTLAKINFKNYTNKAPEHSELTLTLSDKKGLHTLALSDKKNSVYTGTSSYAEKPFEVDAKAGDDIFKALDKLKEEVK